MEKQKHPIQLSILKKLLFAHSLRYTELKPKVDMENNQFDFHLDQLVKKGYVTKHTSEYLLTSTGKEFANRMDTNKKTMTPQAKIGVVVMPFKTGKSIQYLIYTRLKHPFFGCQGFLSGKVHYGDQILDAAKREMKEETNLDGEPKLAHIKHFRVWDSSGKELLEDKFLFYCIVENPKGNVVACEEGKYEWVKEKDLITYVINPFVSQEDFKKDIEMINSFKEIPKFEEIDQYTTQF